MAVKKELSPLNKPFQADIPSNAKRIGIFHTNSWTVRCLLNMIKLFLKFKKTFLPPLGKVPAPTWYTTAVGQAYKAWPSNFILQQRSIYS